MNAALLVLILAVLLSAKTLAGIYLGANYVCPVCGTMVTKSCTVRVEPGMMIGA